jgi:MFS family permease
VHSLLPIFMASVLGAGMVTIGIVEGIAEATASITRLSSGVLSDYVGRRKGLLVFGYGLAALSKPVFPLAGSVTWVLAGRFLDRVGKGIRGAPRDALVADITPDALRGAAYGLRQALDSIGAFIGPLLAVVLMGWLDGNIRSVLWAAVVPALIAVTLLAVAVREPERARVVPGERVRLKAHDMRQLGAGFWWVVLLSATFTLARFSEAFLILRAQSVGLANQYVPTVMIVMNVVYAVSAYPAGAAGDWMGARSLLIAGLVMLILSDGILAFATAPAHVFAGAALWGLHMGLTQGLLSKLVADAAPARLRGTAFGVFNLVAGVALLLASAVAGALWSALGPPATFIAGAAFAVVATAGLSVGPSGRSLSARTS